jgi:capsular exopolysaccharide synthesis family protein
VRERVNDRLRGRGDLEETIAAPVMTQIPAVPAWRNRDEPHLVTLETPKSPAAEAYRTLRTSVLVTAAQQGIKTLMVVSAVAGEGKTTTASNLAVVLAQADKRVVLISADLRRPRLHDYFGLPPSDRGLSEVLSGARRPWEALRSGKVENLWIMSSGRVSEQPTELLQSEAMRELLTDQREVVDFILIDCPPVLAVADALVLVPMVDGVLYVADAQTTPRGAVLQARAQLDQVGARIVGSVLNAVEGAAGYAYYGQYTYPEPATNGANGKARTWGQRRKDRATS